MKRPNDDARPLIDITIQPDMQRFSDLFDAFFGCLRLSASDRPLRDAAIELINLGAPPQTMITARHLSGRRQVMTATLASAAEGLDIGFDVEDVSNVIPFRRPVRPIAGSSGGDVA